MFITSLFWYALSVVMAGLEIEAEGKYGWAEKMPTWYRTTGTIPALYGRIMGGKPLTGYHVFMFFLPLFFMHIPFVSGVALTPEEELRTLSMYFIVCVLWDFLWFVFNPDFGVKNFKKWKVWWHSKSPWVFGLFPLDYLVGLIFSVGMSYAGSRVAHDHARFVQHLTMLGWLAVLTVAGIALAPFYHRWRRGMDKRDDRNKTDIFH